MSSAYKNVRFAKIGYTFIFSNDGTCRYSDDSDMAARLIGSRGFRTALKTRGKSCEPFEHRFLFGGIRYSADFHPFYGVSYICRVYPEDCYLKHAYSGLYNSIADLKAIAATSVAENAKFSEILKDGSYGEEIVGYADREGKRSQRVLDLTSDILKMFDSEHIVEYVPIIDCLENTCDILGKNNGIFGKNINFKIDISRGVAKMNYVLFEAALAGISRILYKCMDTGDESEVLIKERKNGSISVTAAYTAKNGLTAEIPEYDIMIMKCLCESLDGKASADLSGDTLTIKALIPAELSNYYNRLRSGISEVDEEHPGEYEKRGFSAILASDYGRYRKFRAYRQEFVPDLTRMIIDIAMNEIYGDYIG